MSWASVELDEVAASVDYGLTASANENPNGPKFLRITDIQDDKVDWSSVPYCEADDRSVGANLLRDGDIVFARTGATTGKSFLVRNPPERAVFASYLIRVQPSPRIDSGYLAHFFKTPDYWAQIANSARGAAQPGVNSTVLKRLRVPLPPLEEQRRIAAILDAADALRAKRRAALAKLDTLAKSVFIEMFGDVRNMEVRSLKELGKVSTGSTPPSSEKDCFGGKIPFVTPGDLEAEGAAKRTVTEFGATKSRTVKAGASLVCCIGATIGKMGQAQEWSAFNQQINAVEWGREIDPTFGFFALQQIRHVIIHKGKGASTTLPILKKSEFEKLEIAYPRMDRQTDFAARVSAITSTRLPYAAAIETGDALFASLQHRAFRGELQ